MYFNFWGSRPHFVSDAQAEHTCKELMRMLSMRISSLHACLVHASIPDVYAQHGLKVLFKFGMMRMLSMRISS